MLSGEAEQEESLAKATASLTLEESVKAKEEWITKGHNQRVQLIRSRLKNCNAVGEPNFPKELFDALEEVIWDAEFLGAQESYIRRILSTLSIQFSNSEAKNDIGIQPSDTRDLLEHKPTEVIADKWTQIFLHLCLGELENAMKELQTLKEFLEYPAIIRNAETEKGYRYAAQVLELFINKTSGISDKLITFADPSLSDEQNSEIPAYEFLTSKSQCAVMVMKCFVVRNYRQKVMERLDLLKEVLVLDSSNFEWFITRSEMWRRKRRDSVYSRGKRPVNEEFDLVAEAYTLAKENPFVRLSLMDCIIDCIRDSRGHFSCGEIRFDTADETMTFMKDTCRDLLKEFPDSVRINSQISDYFCRFVSFRYFDVAFSEECLQRAYQLNPLNPKTTHRLGIFTRMSKGDIATSFEWFKKTVELDPGHYNAFMECVKNMMGKMDEYNVIKYIDDKLAAPEMSCWTETELLEVLFYKGLAYFMKGETENTLETWDIVCKGNQLIFRMTDLDRTLGFYEWDEKIISTDKLRLWILNEYNKVVDDAAPEPEGAGDVDLARRAKLKARNELVKLLYSFMIGSTSPNRPIPHVDIFGPSPTHEYLMAKLNVATQESGDQ